MKCISTWFVGDLRNCQHPYNPAVMNSEAHVAKLALEDGTVFTGRGLGTLEPLKGKWFSTRR